MIINRSDLEKIGHEDSWKFFVSLYNGTEALRVYRHTIKYCLNLKKKNLEEIIKGERKMSEKERRSFPPGDFVEIDGINMSLRFLVSIQAKDFFQTARNCFDYIAQIINDVFEVGRNVERVDFASINRANISNENVKNYIEEISKSDTYEYLCDYSNTVKHNYDPGVSIMVNTEELVFSGTIPAFSKTIGTDIVHYHEIKNLDDQLTKVHQFVIDKFGELLGLIWPEQN